jgi:small nuclear ribonucleoprotein (snRNP)-like protein
MSIITERLKKNKGKKIKVFLTNGFKFEGKITGCDEDFLEIVDFVTESFKIINISDIRDITLEKEENYD